MVSFDAVHSLSGKREYKMFNCTTCGASDVMCGPEVSSCECGAEMMSESNFGNYPRELDVCIVCGTVRSSYVRVRCGRRRSVVMLFALSEVRPSLCRWPSDNVATIIDGRHWQRCKKGREGSSCTMHMTT